MDPQAFIRLSIGSLGLRVPGTTLNAAKSGIHALSSPCSCEIRLRGFPVQITSVPLVSSPESIPDPQSIASSFYLKESDLKALLTPPIFSCKFSQDRVSQVDPLNAYWSADSPDQDIERRERKGCCHLYGSFRCS
ncbi:uncharacterized protein LOC130793733 [Actinidia eriantha]|uniref:uncharacterized protein LOC130793733 n=1 Tax=Actinidia eriantha TaxID=165200 RepID=UPI00258D2277|nr:uncharacterized protein LOC130793733 [Actinidia eriantha]